MLLLEINSSSVQASRLRAQVVQAKLFARELPSIENRDHSPTIRQIPSLSRLSQDVREISCCLFPS
jgi:hypothetical protein